MPVATWSVVQGRFILGLTCSASPPDRCRSGASTSGPWGGSVTNTEVGAVSCRFPGLVKSRPGSAGAHGAARPSLTGREVGPEARAPRALVFPPLVLTFHEPCAASTDNEMALSVVGQGLAEEGGDVGFGVTGAGGHALAGDAGHDMDAAIDRLGINLFIGVLEVVAVPERGHLPGR